MRLLLVNPSNPLVGLSQAKSNRWNQYRVWRPLGLLIIAGLTPPDWEIQIVDENVEVPDYAALPPADLVGISAFTSQAPRAYEIASWFRARGVPVVMGGIHASVCTNEALQYVDSVVVGEAEGVWKTVLQDVRAGALRRTYHGTFADMSEVPIARHDLLPKGYKLGSIQTTRGCPLACNFCSVTSFNGKKYRFRPVDEVVRELALIREEHVLVVDDNLIGTSRAHIARAKELFRAIIASGIKKKWIGQVTINFGEDDELLALAKQAGCGGVFIGFESPTEEGLREIGKRFHLQKGRDLQASVRRMQAHGLTVVGSFIIGLDGDRPGVGRLIADAAEEYGVDILNLMFFTPLPGTELWASMERQGRIVARDFPRDWRYYTLNHPVAAYNNLSWTEMVHEMDACNRAFYTLPRIARRVGLSAWRSRRFPLLTLAGNLSNYGNLNFDREHFAKMDLSRGLAFSDPYFAAGAPLAEAAE